MSRFLFTTLLLSILFTLQGQQKNEINARDTLWIRIATDTFPYLKTHEGMSRLATNSSVVWLLGGRGNITDTAGNDLAIMQAYFYNLLANRLNLSDTIAIIAESQFTNADKNLHGHYGLRHYVPCFGVDTDSCRKARYLALQYLDYAEAFSTLMPTYHWKWLTRQLRNNLPYESTQVLENIGDESGFYSNGSWEGSTISFSRTAGSINLLISNGPRYPVKVLEWSNASNVWQDVTNISGLDSMPGGQRVYKVDYNLDGYDDLMILRKSSSSKSPAKFFSSLLRNNQKGGFEDVSYQARLQGIERANCACWGDINQDGRPDVFLGNEFSPSQWMIQDSTGAFSNNALGFGIQTIKEIVSDCALIDINEDGLKDLYLSMRDGNNRMFIQNILEGGYRFFYNKADSLGLTSPKMTAHTIVYDHNGDGKEDLVIIPDISDKSDLVSQLMSGEMMDIIEPARVVYTMPFTSAAVLQSDTLSPYLPLMRAGFRIQHPQGYSWIYGGGNATESLLPMMQVNNGKDTMMIQTPQNWPAYVHSATAWSSNVSDVQFSFKGGGQYPFLVNRQASYSYTKEGGSFQRIFDGRYVPVGSVVSYILLEPDGAKQSFRFNYQANDSRGFYALQEWIWLPEGYSIVDVQVEKRVSKPEGKKKRRK